MDTDVSTTPTLGDPPPQVHLVIMGVAGSGKTTVATLLAERMGRPYAEADEFHPQANIDKMSAGTPLTDEDRWPWLRAMRDWLDQQAAEEPSPGVTSSGQKRAKPHQRRAPHRRAVGVPRPSADGGCRRAASRMPC